MDALNAARALSKSLTITPNEAIKHGLSMNRDGQRRSAFRAQLRQHEASEDAV